MSSDFSPSMLVNSGGNSTNLRTKLQCAELFEKQLRTCKVELHASARSCSIKVSKAALRQNWSLRSVPPLSTQLPPFSPRKQAAYNYTVDVRPIKAYEVTELNFSPLTPGISKQMEGTEMLEARGHLVSGKVDCHYSWASRVEPIHSHTCLFPVTGVF